MRVQVAEGLQRLFKLQTISPHGSSKMPPPKAGCAEGKRSRAVSYEEAKQSSSYVTYSLA